MSKLFGISVGPGDPELITLKAFECIKKVDVIVVATKVVEESLAYRIASSLDIDFSNKEKIAIDLPMTKDKKVLELAHLKGADEIEKKLKENKSVGFLVLGDASLYSTYYYVQRIIRDRSYEVETIAGVNSFSAAAASINIDLVSGDESLHIIPATYGVEEAIKLNGNKIFMKAGKSLIKLKSLIEEDKAIVFNNVGLEDEKVYKLSEVEDAEGYYTLVLVKD